jgi:hypothetical protein
VTSTTHFGKQADVPPETFGKGSHKHVPHELVRDPSALAEYRARWINEPEPALRLVRFTSAMTSSLATSVAPAHQVSVQRFLVGVPKSVEVLRMRAADEIGVDAVLRLALTLPATYHRSASSMVNPLRMALQAKGVKVSADQANELWKFLDPTETLEAHRDDLIRALLGHPFGEARLAAVQRAWGNLTELSKGHRVTMGTVRATFDGAAHVDVRRKPVPRFDANEGLKRVYEGLAAVVAFRTVTDDGKHVANSDVTDATAVSYEAFEDYFAFLSATLDSDEAFVRMLDMGFRIGAPGQGPAVRAAPLNGTLAFAGANSGLLAPASPAKSVSASSVASPTRSLSPASTRGPSAGEAFRVGGGPRTTYSEIGSGLAFATKPYKPKTRDASPSPNRRQSRAPHAVDADMATASAVTHVVLLVTHGDGSKKLYKIPKDRFLDRKDEEGLRERLAKAGVFDIAHVKSDF